MKLQLVKATTSQTVLIFIQDSSSTVGAGLAGLTSASSGLTAYYYREGAGTGATAISLVAVGLLGTWESGGFFEVDATNMPGWYEVGLPDAVLATGVDFVGVQLKGATNMAQTNLEIQLTTFDVNSTSNAVGVAASVSGAVGSVTGSVGSVVGHTAQTADHTAAIAAIPTTAMRGTDSAALASVCTEARLAELAAANLPTDVAALSATLGVEGAGLLAIPWNLAWDAEVQSECTDALNTYDGPTKLEMDTKINALNNISTTDVNAQCTGALNTYDAPKKSEMDSAFAALNNISAAAVNAEVDTVIQLHGLNFLVGSSVLGVDVTDNSIMAKLVSKSATADWDDFVNTTDSLQAVRDNQQPASNAAMVALHLDHLLAATYDPASKPGAADALLNELVENDGGVSRYTANALEQAPSAGGGETQLRTGTAQAGASTTITLDAGASALDDFYNYAIIAITGGTGVSQSRIIEDYVGSTKVATVAAWVTDPDNTSTFVILPLGQIPGVSAPTAADVADAVWDESLPSHATGTAAALYLLDASLTLALSDNTAQAGSSTTITLAATENANDDIYNDQIIYIRQGTGTGQARLITDYDGTTFVATVTPAWITNPSSSSKYRIIPNDSSLSGAALAPAVAAAMLTADLGASLPTKNTVAESLMLSRAHAAGTHEFVGTDRMERLYHPDGSLIIATRQGSPLTGKITSLVQQDDGVILFDRGEGVGEGQVFVVVTA